MSSALFQKPSALAEELSVFFPGGALVHVGGYENQVFSWEAREGSFIVRVTEESHRSRERSASGQLLRSGGADHCF